MRIYIYIHIHIDWTRILTDAVSGTYVSPVILTWLVTREAKVQQAGGWKTVSVKLRLSRTEEERKRKKKREGEDARK